MEIRDSIAGEESALAELHRVTFGEPEGETIGQLVRDLFADPTAQPLLSLVAADDGELAGHVLFTPVLVDGEQADAYIMAPLAVAASYQKQGVGTRLIEKGLAALKERGVAIVLVLGDPAYYSRHGFAAGHGLKPPFELQYPEAWMAQELRSGALAERSGTVRCAAALNEPQHWLPPE